ncbi:hypothetical protein P886_4750 [Alteromonadaceae bacterium 2753L.S.0a.02]|nr:hypothetical protein P886_4750 [Alteromonadaceae bacterium 2753L.S.0a.02]
MKTQFGIKILFVSLFIALANASFAGDYGIKIDDPTWCRGLNPDGQCVTYFGSRESCKSLRPCDTFEAADLRTPFHDKDIYFCYGLNSLDRCVLFMGTEEMCNNVTPC